MAASTRGVWPVSGQRHGDAVGATAASPLTRAHRSKTGWPPPAGPARSRPAARIRAPPRSLEVAAPRRPGHCP
eukprot:scaffold23630_cov129-Isochrysis_galbana.AAC.2